MQSYYIVYVCKKDMDAMQYFNGCVMEIEGLFKPIDIAQEICDNNCYEEVLLINWKEVTKEQIC